MTTTATPRAESVDAATDTERWAPFPDFEGAYEVSSHGRVRSLDRVVISKIGRRRHFPSIVRAPQVKADGYVIASLSVGGRSTSVSVHVAVAKAFLGPKPEGHEVAHGDGNPGNNHVSNLRWATPSENAADKFIHGTDYQTNKTHCPQGHPYSERNIKWEGGGRHRKCRTCANQRLRDWAASGRRRATRKPALCDVRVWALAQGFELAPTGRLPRAVHEAYAASLHHP